MHTWLIVITILACVLVGTAVGMTTFMRSERTAITLYDDNAFHVEPLPTQPLRINTTTPITAPTPTQSTTISDWTNGETIRTQPIPTTATPTAPPEDAPPPPTPTTPTPQPETSQEDSFNIWEWLPTGGREREAPAFEPLAPDLSAYTTYGNALGKRIKSFTRRAGDQNATLSSFIAGRGTTGNKDALLTLATNYETLNNELLAIEGPDAFTPAGQALAESYATTADALRNLAEATDDADTLKRIYAYNAVVDEFATNFISLATRFGAFGVTFTQGEGGDIFTPPVR